MIIGFLKSFSKLCCLYIPTQIIRREGNTLFCRPWCCKKFTCLCMIIATSFSLASKDAVYKYLRPLLLLLIIDSVRTYKVYFKLVLFRSFNPPFPKIDWFRVIDEQQSDHWMQWNWNIQFLKRQIFVRTVWWFWIKFEFQEYLYHFFKYIYFGLYISKVLKQKMAILPKEEKFFVG